MAPVTHTFEGVDCACRPTYLRLCLECQGIDPTCWHCKGKGYVEVARRQVAPDDEVVVVHRDPDRA